MRGKASGYGVSGSGEYDRVDYQEHRKDTAIGFGMLIAFIAIVGFGLYWLWTKTIGATLGNNPITDAVKGVGATVQASTEGIVTAAKNPVSVTDAKNTHGAFYPVKTLTSDDWNKMLEGAGAPISALVKTGQLIVPKAITDSQTALGVTAAKTVNTLGLNDAYVQLPPIQKGLVTLGEFTGLNLGFDPIKMGYDFRANIVASKSLYPNAANQWLSWGGGDPNG